MSTNRQPIKAQTTKKKSSVPFCLTCGDELWGRADKKFCNDYCRSAYNNKLPGRSKSLKQEIDQALKKNRTILQQLLQDKLEIQIAKQDLFAAGFNFQYLTHLSTASKEVLYFHCYEYRYRMIEEMCELAIHSDSVDEPVTEM